MSVVSVARAARCDVLKAVAVSGALLLLAGCIGAEQAERANKNYVEGARKAAGLGPATPAAAPGATPAAEAPEQGAAAPEHAAAAPAAGAAQAPAGGAGGGGSPTPKAIALGDSIFHGQVAGGTCTACHGQDAKGTAIAPNLTDAQWLNGDGSYDFVVKTVTTGVEKPKAHPAPMPPMGGAQLTPEQVQAVAAYVYSLSHKT